MPTSSLDRDRFVSGSFAGLCKSADKAARSVYRQGKRGAPERRIEGEHAGRPRKPWMATGGGRGWWLCKRTGGWFRSTRVRATRKSWELPECRACPPHTPEDYSGYKRRGESAIHITPLAAPYWWCIQKRDHVPADAHQNLRALRSFIFHSETPRQPRPDSLRPASERFFSRRG